MHTTRVLIVDDSVVIRRLLTDALSADPRVEVVATASNGRLALAKLESVEVDVVVLDIEMPELNGLETLREIRKTNRRLPVIMFSTLTEHGARTTVEALAAGASDYVTKPANVGSVTESREAVRTQLLPRVLALGGSGRGSSPAATPVRARPAGPTVADRYSTTIRQPGAAAGASALSQPSGSDRLRPLPAAAAAPGGSARPGGPVVLAAAARSRPRVLAIGCSTGGPEALSKLIPQLPVNLGVPILIVQHMPPLFTTMLAERLNRVSSLCVEEVTTARPLLPGRVYLAPGDFHLEIAAGGSVLSQRCALSTAPAENFCRPSVDVLFRSVARAYGASVLAVVLTGMGSDGRAGAEQIVRAGGEVIVQDQDSSVVWGMPGVIAGAGLASQILPLDRIATAIVGKLGSAVETPAASAVRA